MKSPQMDPPELSVILPVFNGEKTVLTAINSILRQTFQNYELVVINDGSTDGTRSILHTLTDERVRVLEQANQGLVAALNRGILESSGQLIARMDADDIAMPDRLERQVTFLDQHPEVVVVGTAGFVMYPDGRLSLRQRPTSHKKIIRNIVRINPFFHSSVCMRREPIINLGLYDAQKDSSRELLVEDYDLWIRLIAAGYELANLSEPLITYRITRHSIIQTRSLFVTLSQRVKSRMQIIRELDLGPFQYFNILPVIVATLLGHAGIRLDRFFNMISR